MDFYLFLSILCSFGIENDPKTLEVAANLVILRGVFGVASTDSTIFHAWLKDVVDVAVAERRDVRVRDFSLFIHVLISSQPDAPGKMVQVGFNAGPRHARVFGLAKSYTKPLDNTTKTEHDNDIIAATTTVWAAAKTWLPTDITQRIDDELERHSMPRIATRNVNEGIQFIHNSMLTTYSLYCLSGPGFVLGLNGITYSFPEIERAPPEAYLTVDYSA